MSTHTRRSHTLVRNIENNDALHKIGVIMQSEQNLMMRTDDMKADSRITQVGNRALSCNIMCVTTTITTCILSQRACVHGESGYIQSSALVDVNDKRSRDKCATSGELKL
jgi:hypothetical protein